MTREIPGLGNFVSLEGDPAAIWKTFVHPRSTEELTEIADRANGYFHFPKFRVTPYVFHPLHVIYAIRCQWDQTLWNSHDARERRQKHGLYGDIVWESDKFRELGESPKWSEFRQTKLGGLCPSIVQSLAFLPFHHICAGFPLDRFMSYRNSLMLQFKSWWIRNRESPNVNLDTEFQNDIEVGHLRGLDVRSRFCMTKTDVPQPRSRSWIFDDWNDLFQVLTNNDLQNPVVRGVATLLDCDQLNSNRQFKPFPIIPLVYNFLDSGDLAKIQKEIDARRIQHVHAYMTAEAALWLTLAMVDKRIQRACSTMENASDDPWKYRSGLLAFWCDACNHSDTGKDEAPADRKNVEAVLSEWKDNISQCIECPQETVDPANVAPQMIRKKDFYDWVTSSNPFNRKQIFLETIRWLQFRSILLFYYLQCHGDSSNSAIMETMSLHVRMI